MYAFLYKYTTAFLLCCLSLQAAFAQDAEVQNLLNKANKYYDAFAYKEAIPFYRDVLIKDNLLEAKVKLAECYRLTNDLVNAEYWYRIIINQLPVNEHIYKLRFAQILQTNGNCVEAKKWFLEYGKHNDIGNKLAKGCDMITRLTEHEYDYNTWLLPINSKAADFAPALYSKGLVFCSNREELMGKSGKTKQGQFLNLYYSEFLEGGNFTTPKPLKGSINSPYNDGPITFTQNADSAIFTRNAAFLGKKQRDTVGTLLLSLYTAQLQKNGKWGNVRKFKFNNVEDEYDKLRTHSMTHPGISPDGQNLFFVSDMEGGYGGTDIYICTRIDSTWSRPVNLGPQINTSGNELFPFMHADGNLYFASNGHAGLGGLDIFYTRYNRTAWQTPVNIGAPFNSRYDDFSITLNADNNWGFFTSNRPGGFGNDDIYYFTRVPDAQNLPTEQPTKPETVNVDQPQVNTSMNEGLDMQKIKFKKGDWTVNPDAQKELDKLLLYMAEYPEINIEIAAHTDSRGNDFVNLEISQKRANAIRDYLVLKGANPTRLFAKGYGESMLLNDCVSNAECPEELHQQNNRIEFTATSIQGINNFPSIPIKPAPIPATNEAPQIINPELEALYDAGTGVLQYRVLIGPYKNVDNNIYYNFAELNTGINMEYVGEGMLIVLGPYSTIAEAETYEQLAKERGGKKVKIVVYKGNYPSNYTIKQLKKMGVK
ncbi:MAG TPA: OmpA family protein [Chitinophagales bacterium]|nr:OmpA family protein [Chitinophagales bacterium]